MVGAVSLDWIPPLRQPRKAKPRAIIPPEVKQRYVEAHHIFTKNKSEDFFDLSGGKDMRVNVPDTNTSNGLNYYIQQFLIWNGHRATRINVQGRLIETINKQPSGAQIKVKKFLKSSTRKGAADVSSTIRGMSVMWEGKIGNDKPSDEQLREQALEIAAGGRYYFVKTAKEFLDIYDSLFVS